MTIREAVETVKAGVIPGLRGVGCAAIVMADGRRFGLVSEFGPPILERHSDGGDLLQRVPATAISGEVADVHWGADELGGIIC